MHQITPQNNSHTDKCPQVSIYVPALNEEHNIATVANEIVAGCQKATVTFEIVFVDDGSTDGTLAEMKKIAEKLSSVQILHHRKPSGITQTMLSAFRKVRGEIILWIPADMECSPKEDIPKLLNKMRDDDLDVVCGWRQDRQDGKSIASWIYNKISSLLFPVNAHDMNWIKAFKKECLENLYLRSDWHRFLIMIWSDQGYTIGEVPTKWYPRKSGRTKFGIMRFPIAFFDVLALRFLLTFSRKPLVFFGTFGIASIAAGFAIDLYLWFLYVFAQTQRRPVLILGFILIVIGFFLVCFGFLAELLIPEESACPEKRNNKSGS